MAGDYYEFLRFELDRGRGPEIFEANYENDNDGIYVIYDENDENYGSCYKLTGLKINEEQTVKVVFVKTQYEVVVDNIDWYSNILIKDIEIAENLGLTVVELGSFVGSFKSVDYDYYSNYKFLGWKFKSDDDMRNNIIEDAFELTEEMIDQYVNEENKLVVQAFYEKYYTITFEVGGEDGDLEGGSYEVLYTDEIRNNYDVSGDYWTPVSDLDQITVSRTSKVLIKFFPSEEYMVSTGNSSGENGIISGDNYNLSDYDENWCILDMSADRIFVFDYVLNEIYFYFFNYQFIDGETYSILSDEPFNKNVIFEVYENNFLKKDTISFYENVEPLGIYMGMVRLNDQISIRLAPNNQPADYRFDGFYVMYYNSEGDKYENLLLYNNMFTVDNEFLTEFSGGEPVVYIFAIYTKLCEIKILSTNPEEEKGMVTVKYNGVTQTFIDAELDEGVIFLDYMDMGTEVEIVCSYNTYYQFKNITGVLQGEVLAWQPHIVSFVLTDDREFAVWFNKQVYDLNFNIGGSYRGELEYDASTISINDEVVMTFNPNTSYQVIDWKLNGKGLDEYENITVLGNTIVIVVTKEFLDGLSLVGSRANISTDIETIMNPTSFYSIIFIPLAMLLLAALIIFLVYRKKKIEKDQRALELKLSQVAARFNITDVLERAKKE